MKIPGIKTAKKDTRLINKKIKPFEKDPRTYSHHERLIVIGATMFVLSLYGKYISLDHWYSVSFDMSSYPPVSAVLAVAGTFLAFMYAYYKKDMILESLALIGIGVALVFSAGIINTYYWQWCWW